MLCEFEIQRKVSRWIFSEGILDVFARKDKNVVDIGGFEWKIYVLSYLVTFITILLFHNYLSTMVIYYSIAICLTQISVL